MWAFAAAVGLTPVLSTWARRGRAEVRMTGRSAALAIDGLPPGAQGGPVELVLRAGCGGVATAWAPADGGDVEGAEELFVGVGLIMLPACAACQFHPSLSRRGNGSTALPHLAGQAIVSCYVLIEFLAFLLLALLEVTIEPPDGGRGP